MDLRGNQITLGELWDDPKAREVFKRRFPMIAKHPVQLAARAGHQRGGQRPEEAVGKRRGS